METVSKFEKHKTSLKAGQKAPEFCGTDQFAKTVCLKDFAGKKVVLYFYPQDDTPGCTTQSCNLRDNYEELLRQGFVILGVSADSVKSHLKFANKFNLPFSLIADENKEIISAYDVYGKKKFMGITFKGIVRTTFVIDEQGMIEGIIDNVDTGNHSSQLITLGRGSL
jgi:peroxiredoxin Q/BCP